VSLFPNLTLILAWGVLISLINPGVNLSHFNILLKLCPDERRASYMAIFAAMMNVGAFVGPMVGVALSNLWGVRPVLLIGGAIRLLGAALFYAFRVKVNEVEIR
jgi:MFS family permease